MPVQFTAHNSRFAKMKRAWYRQCCINRLYVNMPRRFSRATHTPRPDAKKVVEKCGPRGKASGPSVKKKNEAPLISTTQTVWMKKKQFMRPMTGRSRSENAETTATDTARATAKFTQIESCNSPTPTSKIVEKPSKHTRKVSSRCSLSFARIGSGATFSSSSQLRLVGINTIATRSATRRYTLDGPKFSIIQPTDAVATRLPRVMPPQT
mmetsp:Transcript_54648/g.108727  ORF Transcript_54648/g.108727 Transcript_54648/m.108727 type:complete len:209 (+) Transcript_54648:583-1209(+)